MATATNTRRAGVRRSEQRQEAADAAELALLGVIIRDTPRFPIFSPPSEEMAMMFRSHANRVLYRVIQQLDAEGIPVDLVSLANQIHERFQIEDVGYHHLAELKDAAPSSANWQTYAKIVQDAAKERSLALFASELGRALQDSTGPVSETLSRAQERLADIASENGPQSAGPDIITASDFWR